VKAEDLQKEFKRVLADIEKTSFFSRRTSII
jgi:hypothetical protein